MKRISLFTFFIFLGIAGCMAQVSGEKIEKVYVASLIPQHYYKIFFLST